MMLSPKVVAAGESPVLHVVGDRLRCLLDGKATGGVFSMFEVRTPPGAGSPPHIHRREEETFYIIEGEMEFWIDGKTIKAGPGASVFGPRDVAHCFKNVGSKAAHMIMVVSPAGLEEFFRECAVKAPEVPPPMPAFLELCAKYGLELLPPK